MDDRIAIILRGRLREELPVQRSKLVRIFTSSTFTDTSVERNALMREVYPRLKDYCKSRHGLDFQVIDMRWGVRDEATDDHMTSELCMKEIGDCQRLSIGPNFVTFLCQKYGYRPFPPKIPASTFNLLRETLVSASTPVDLLDEWFLLDENTLPPVYILQPISSKLPYFSRQDEPDKMKADQGQWWATFETIQSQLKMAASTCLSEGKLNDEQARQFIISVTHDEVSHGILEAPGEKEDHCLCFIRRFNNLKSNNGVREARNFIDIQDGEVDEEAQKLLDNLRDVEVPKVLSSAKIYVNDLPDWTDKGVDITDEVYKKYLATFLDTFYKEMVSMIDRAMSKAKRESISNPLCVEILQHLSFCKTKCVGFQGREDLLEKVKAYVQAQASGGSNGSPFILHGESGSGKTSVMAKCVSDVSSNWQTNTEGATIIRFLGTSPSSASIRRVLHSLCQQIQLIYNGEESADIPQDYIKLVTAFAKCLRLATAEKPLAIFLDSLDQLSSENGAHRMAWLPKILPDYVAIIVSTLPEEHGILEALTSLLPSTTTSLQVAAFTVDESAKVVASWLTSSNKAVTTQQEDLMKGVAKQCSLPLFLKLVFDELCRWRSYHDIKECILYPSVTEMISLIFDRLEDYHGKMLVSRALAYLTIAPGGIAESELEDLLSLDDDVLNDVYQFWLPPVRRIPPSLWTRAKSDISSYLVEREADGVNVVFWYHRQFIETARKRYLHNQDDRKALHVKCAEYFQGLWSDGRKKPCRYSDRQLKMFDVPKEAEEDRIVAAQPLVFQDNDNDEGETRYNLRKLTQLPFHLTEAGDIESLKKHVLCNFDFISSKLNALSIQEVLEDFERAEEKLFDEEADLIGDSLRLSASVIAKEPAQLAPELVGRLTGLAEKHPNIKAVVDRAQEICGRTFPVTPVNTCLQPPGGMLLTSLEGHNDDAVAVQVTSDSRLVVTGSKDNTARVWTLADGSLLHELKGHREGVYGIEITPDDQQVLTYTHNGEYMKSGKMCVWNLETGDLIHRLKGHTGKNRSNVALSVDGLYAVSGFETTESNDSDNEDTDYEDDIVETRNKGTMKNGNLKLEKYSDAEDDDDNEDDYGDVTRDEDYTQMVVGVWSMENGKMLHWLMGHKDEVEGITTIETDDGRQVAISYSRDYTMIFWNLSDGQAIRRVQDHDNFHISVVQMSHDKRHLAIHGNDVSIHRSDGKFLFDMEDEGGSSSPINAFHFTRDNKRVISTHNTGTVMIFDMEDKKLIKRKDLEEDVDRDYSIDDSVVTPDDKWIILATGKEDALVYSVDNLELVAKLPHTTTVDKLAMTVDGSRLLTASGDKNVRVWDINKIGKEQHSGAKIDKHNDIITSINFLHRQDHVITTGYDEKVFKVWDLNTGKLLKSPATPNDTACGNVAITSDDTRLIVTGGCEWYVLQLPDFTLLNTFRERKAFPIPFPSHFVLTPDNRRLVAGVSQPEHSIRIYDVASGDTLSVIKMWSTSLHMLPNGMALNQFYSQMYDSSGKTKIIQMVNSNTGQAVCDFIHGGKVLHYAVSPDDSMMACGCDDKDVYLWDLTSGSQIAGLKGHSDRVGSVVFSTDNQMVASGADGGEVIIWSTRSHKALHSLKGHKADIDGMTFSANNKYLFTCSESELNIIIWCTESGKRVMTYSTYAVVSRIYMSSFSNTCVAGLRDGRLLMLRVSDQFDATASPVKLVSFTNSTAPESKEAHKAENQKKGGVPSSASTQAPITTTSSCCILI